MNKCPYKQYSEDYFQYLLDNNIQFEEDDFRRFLWEYQVDAIPDEPRRWSQFVDAVCKLKDKYYMFSYDRGLTEMQEDEFWESEQPYEVEPYEKTITITAWRPKQSIKGETFNALD